MKKILLCLVAVLFATVAFSQDDNGRQQRRQREFNPEEFALRSANRLNEALQLDTIQYQAVFLMYLSDAMTMQDSLNARRARAEQMRENGERPQFSRPTEEQMKAAREMQEQRQAVRDEQMKELLTPEQYEKYQQLQQEEQRQRNGNWQRGPRRGNRGDRRPRE